MSIGVRPFVEQDSVAILPIADAAVPYDRAGNERWLRLRQQFDERHFIRRQYVAEDDETRQIVGYCAVEQQGPDPRRLRLYLVVYPELLWSGVGEALYQRLLDDLPALHTTVLWMREYQQASDLLTFMQGYGFVQTQLIWDLRLSLTKTGVAHLVPTVERVAGSGILIAPIEEERRRAPGLPQRLHELFNAVQADVFQPLDFETFLQRLARPTVLPQGFFVARNDECLIGLSVLERQEGYPDEAVQSWTGVRPEYRRQGIATALRLCTIDAAQRMGFQTLVTYTDHTDPLALALNEKLGFRRWFGYVTLEKTLEAAS